MSNELLFTYHNCIYNTVNTVFLFFFLFVNHVCNKYRNDMRSIYTGNSSQQEFYKTMIIVNINEVRRDTIIWLSSTTIILYRYTLFISEND